LTTIAEFLAQRAREDQNRNAAAAGLVVGSVTQSPDEVAGDMRLAREFTEISGRPVTPEIVRDNRPLFQQRVETFRTGTVLSGSPKLSAWLQNPQNAALARDDIEGMSWWERTGTAFEMGEATAIQQGQNLTRDLSVAAERGALGRGLDQLRDAVDQNLLTRDDGTPNALGRLTNIARERAMQSDGMPRQMVGGPDVTPQERAVAISEQDFNLFYEGAARTLEQLREQGFEPMSYRDVRGLGSGLQFFAENLGMSLPQMLSTFASGGFAPIVTALTQGGEANAELAERTDLDPDTRAQIALGTGIVMSGLEFIGLGRIFAAVPAGQVANEIIEGTIVDRLVSNGLSQATGRVLNAAITEGTTEALQEGLVMTVTELSGGEYTAEEVRERLLQAFTAGGAVGGGLRGGVEASSATARRLTRDEERAAGASSDADRVRQMSERAAQSRVRERAPEAFREFVERAADGTPVENVYVPAERFVEYFQSQGVDPFELADALSGVSSQDLRDAVATGGDLQIPTATYASEIAGSEYDSFLAENMRFDPDGMTVFEAQEWETMKADLLAEAYSEMEAMRQEDEAYRSYEQEIYDTMVSRLRVAGRSTDVATNEARVYAAFYRTMAERSGMTMDDFMRAYPLPQVQGDVPQGMQLRNVDELNRTLAEARALRTLATDRRQTLLEWISDYGGIEDRGGELRARDAEVIRRGRGRSNLRLARDFSGEGQASMFGAGEASGRRFGPDDVAQAAIEAGFMADDPIVMEYQEAMRTGREVPDITRALYEAIDRELRGETQFSQFDQRDEQIDRDQMLADMEEYLSRIGVSLDDDDATIRAAMEADSAERGRMYGQDGRIRTDSEAFRQWFGDSKVVDAEGKPLVVYHGTDADFEAFDPAFLGETTRATSSKAGFFFTDDAVTARSYADHAGMVAPVQRLMEEADRLGDMGDWDGYDAKIIQAEELEAATSRDAGQVIVATYLSIQNPLEFDAQGEVPDGIPGGINGLIDRARAEGRDGVIIRNLDDAAGLSNQVADHYIAFSPTQIKSVNNRGTFDPEDPRILYQGANEAAPEYAVKPPKKLWRGVVTGEQADGSEGLGTFMLGRGLYSSPDKKFAAMYGKPQEVSIEDGWPRNPLVLRGQATGPDLFRDYVMKNSGFRNMREFNRAYPDPGDWVRSLGFDGVIAGDEVVRYAAPERPAMASLLADARERIARKETVSESLAASGDPVLFRTSDGRRAMAGPDMSKPGGFRLTYVGDDGQPSGHSEFASMRDAIRRALDDGFDPVLGRTYNQPAYHGSPPLFQEQRGSIRFPAAGIGNGDTVISLFRQADLSTLLHESGHFFLTVMQDLASRGDENAIKEIGLVRDWWRSNADAVAKDAMRVMTDVEITADDVIAALDNGTTGDAMKDSAVDVGMQEQAARAFEAYLMEGKAPSADLRSVFEKFRAWLVSVYKSIRGLNVEISDEMRGVFDRMLATDEEIEKARIASGETAPLFASAEEMGLTDEQYRAFLDLNEKARADAAAKVLAETMEPIRRETQKWYRAEREKVRAEVEREINGFRQYRAFEWMANRRWLGDGKPEALPDVRLSKQALIDRYGEGVLKTLPRGKYTVYAVDGGMDPDDAAGFFGFSSGDEMVKMLEQSPPRKQAIEDQTDRVMYERHGDPLNDGSIQEQALASVHGDVRGRVIETELKALADVAGLDVPMTHRQAREIARETLARTKVRDALRTGRYLAAERKAAEEAQRLAQAVTRTGMWMDAARRKLGRDARAAVREGDARAAARVERGVDPANERTSRYNENVQKLIEAKRRQLLNHAMYDEARRIQNEVEASERLVKRLQKKSIRDRLAGDYLEAIDELLTRYDFRKISGRAEDRRGALNAFVERMKAEGRENELAIPDTVLNDARMTPYKTLTVEHLRGVVDSLKNIEHTARMKKKLQDAQSQRELDAVVEAIEENFEKNMPSRPPSRVATTGEKARGNVRKFLNLVLNAGTLLREIDGGDYGAAFENVKAPIDAAMNRLQARRQEAAVDLDGLYDVYSKTERRAMAKREYIPEIGTSMSKWERIAVALNMGNEGNYQRLTDQRVRGAFTPAQVQAIIATLDERDARFVQSVWDYLDTFRKDIEAREKRVTGVAPKWVEAKPVTIAGVTLKGGYYPLKYDPRLSSMARDDAAQDIAASLQAGRFGKAQTRNGHTKERAQSSGRAVELDMSVLHRHVQQVVYDLELSEPVANSWRILQDPRIRSAFIDAGRQADFDALEIWLKDTAQGEILPSDLPSQTARRLKSNFTSAKLAFNLSTVAVQLTGLAQSMVVVGKKDFVKGVVASYRPGVREDVIAKSQFMRDRESTFNKDIFDLYNDPRVGPVMGRWSEIRNEWIAPLGLWLMTKVQFYAVDMPTWMASYDQGLRKYANDEAKAVAYADDMVKRAQASGLFSDRSAVERGSASQTQRQNEFIRLFTALGSYMFTKFNVAYERTRRAGRVINEEGASLRSLGEAMSWTLDMAFLFALEAVLYAAIKGRLPSEDDDEDDDGMADEWAMFIARETGLSFISTIPFVRDAGSVMTGFESGGAYGAITSEFARPFVQIGQGEVDAALVKSIISATGLATGLPSSQINRAVDAGWRQIEGEDVSPAEYLLGRMNQ